MTCDPADDAPYWAVTGPTMLDDVPEDVYHSGGVVTPGPQVSQSGLKMLRPPSTPREFQHYLLNGLPPSRALDKGSAAHTCALGRGQEFVPHPRGLLTIPSIPPRRAEQ